MGGTPSKVGPQSPWNKLKNDMAAISSSPSEADLFGPVPGKAAQSAKREGKGTITQRGKTTGRVPPPAASPPPYSQDSATPASSGTMPRPARKQSTSPIATAEDSHSPLGLPGMYVQPGEELLASATMHVGSGAARARTGSEGSVLLARPAHNRAAGSFDFTKRIGRNLQMLGGGRRKRSDSAAMGKGPDGSSWLLVESAGDAEISQPFNTQHDLHVSPDLSDLPSEWLAELHRLGLQQSDLNIMAAAIQKQKRLSSAGVRISGSMGQLPIPLDRPPARDSSKLSSPPVKHIRASSTPDALAASGPPRRRKHSPYGSAPSNSSLRINTGKALPQRHAPDSRSQSRSDSRVPLLERFADADEVAFAGPSSLTTPLSPVPPSPYTANKKRISAELKGFAALRIDQDDGWADDLWNAVVQRSAMADLASDDYLGSRREQVASVQGSQGGVFPPEVSRRSSSTLNELPLVSRSTKDTKTPVIRPVDRSHGDEQQEEDLHLSAERTQPSRQGTAPEWSATGPRERSTVKITSPTMSPLQLPVADASSITNRSSNARPVLSLPLAAFESRPATQATSPELATPGELPPPRALPALRFEVNPRVQASQSGRLSPPPWTRSALPQPPSVESLRRKNRLSEALSVVSAADSNHSLGDLGSATVNTAYSADLRSIQEDEGGVAPRVGRPRTFFLSSE